MSSQAFETRVSELPSAASDSFKSRSKSIFASVASLLLLLSCSGDMQDGTAEANGQAGSVDALEAPIAEATDLEFATVAQAFTAVEPGTRRTIWSYSAADRKILADAILEFITKPVLDEHENAHTWHHVSEFFFSGHHGYLNELENYLLANGLKQFVPVPMWNPGTQIPAEFLVKDPLVSHYIRPLNANPNMPPPSSITNPCSQPAATARALALSISDWHDQVHRAVGQEMNDPDLAPGTPIFWLWHGFLDDAYHTYEACMTRRADVTATLTPAVGNWGDWHPTVYCPPGQYATAFQMRVEGNQGKGDDSSLNSVQLQCRALRGGANWWVSSHNGYWGSWGGIASCSNASYSSPTNFMTAASLRVEPPQGSGDDTGANDATFRCRAGDTINPGGGRPFGNWSNYATCPADSAICGIGTRVEGQRGSGDDTAMNGMRLECCRLPWSPWGDVSTLDVLARNTDGDLRLYRPDGVGGWKDGNGAEVDNAGDVDWQSFLEILAPGDFDGDGNRDLIARNTSGELALYAGDGAGGLATGSGTEVGWGFDMFDRVVAPGDFDGDRKPDLIGRKPDGTLWLYAGNGKGGWKTGIGTQIQNSRFDMYDLIVTPGDFDGDKRADLIMRKPDGTLWLRAGNGTGGWKNSAATEIGRDWGGFTAVFAQGDFNGDRLADVLARTSTGDLLAYYGNGAGGWKTAAGVPVGNSWQGFDLLTAW